MIVEKQHKILLHAQIPLPFVSEVVPNDMLLQCHQQQLEFNFESQPKTV